MRKKLFWLLACVLTVGVATAQEEGAKRRQVEYAMGYAMGGEFHGLSQQFQYSHGVAQHVDLLLAMGNHAGCVGFGDDSREKQMQATTALALGAKLHGTLGKRVEVGLSALAGSGYSLNQRNDRLAGTVDWHVAARGDVSCRLSQNLQLGAFYTLSTLSNATHTVGLALRFRLP